MDQARSGDELDYDEPFDDEQAGQEPAGIPRAEGGPWDAEESYPAQERVDLGSLHVPVGPEHEIQLVMAEQHGAWVTVKYRESELQIQAFAAARRGALWDDVRAEIAAEVLAAGGRSEEVPGSFGIELMAQVPARPRPATSKPTCLRRSSGTPWWSGASTRYRRGRYLSSDCLRRRVRRSKSRPPRRKRRTGSGPT